MGKRIIILVVLTLSGGIVVSTHERILFSVGNFLVIKDRLQQADVIHTIAGPDYRMDYAIDLYKQRYGKKLFFTGGWCAFHKIYHGMHSKEHAIEQGVTSEDIFIDESEVHSTYAEILRLKAFIMTGPDPVHSVIIVSDPHHMRRLRWTCQKVLGEGVKVWMVPVPFERSPYKEKWWVNEESREFVKSEYLKILYYHARYQWSRGGLQNWLASLDKD